MATGTWIDQIEQGETWSRTLTFNNKAADGTLTPIDLTGYTASMPLETSLGVQLTLSTDPDGGIVVDSNTLTFTITPIQTASLAGGLLSGKLLLTAPNGQDIVWVKGEFEVND